MLSLEISTAALSNDIDENDEIDEGDELTYTITATNNGDDDQENVAISVTAPTTANETCETVASDETCELEYTYTVTAEDVANDEIVVDRRGGIGSSDHRGYRYGNNQPFRND